MKSLPLKPFLKWAGGKRWLFTCSQFALPHFTGKFFEPFLGGGAVFFEVRPNEAKLSDTNERLIELYSVVRDKPVELESILRNHAKRHSKDYYYKLRDKELVDLVNRAAQFLYLNRTCWNGLYRENLEGKFNVPIGTKQTVLFENDDFLGWSRALANAKLECCDFEKSIDQATEGDYIFADPPYVEKHNSKNFIKYNYKLFCWEDQIRLRNALGRAVERGASFAMTNANHKSVKDLYIGFGEHWCLSRHSVIAAHSSHRSQSSELLVLGGEQLQYS